MLKLNFIASTLVKLKVYIVLFWVFNINVLIIVLFEEQATAVSIDDAIVMDCALLIVTKLAKDLVTQVGFVHLSEASQAVAVAKPS